MISYFCDFFRSFSLTKYETNCPSIMLRTIIKFKIFFHGSNISARNAVVFAFDNANSRHTENEINFVKTLGEGNI